MSRKVGTGTLSFYTVSDGVDGEDRYTWIKYADSPTSGISDSPEGKDYLGIAYNKLTPTPSNDYSDYTWSLIKGADGIDGADGQTTYTWVKYADDEHGNGMSDSPNGKKYIGLAFNKTTATESTVASDYTWSLMPQNITIGGRNLILGSGIPVSSSAYMVAEYFISEDFIEGQEYTVTIKGTKNSAVDFGLWQNAGSSERGSLNHVKEDLYQLTFTSVATTAGNERRVRIYQSPSGSASEATIEWIKLEKGNIATDWTPAPEDTAIYIGTAPANPQLNQLWLDTSVDPNVLNRWDGNFWVSTQYIPENEIKVSETEPFESNPSERPDGFLWLSTTANQLLRWDAWTNSWVAVKEDIETVIEAVATSQTVQNMFNKKANVTDLDVFDTIEDVNAKLEAVKIEREEAETVIRDRIQAAEEHVGTIETRLSTLPGEIIANFSTSAAGINLLRNSIGFANGWEFIETTPGQFTKRKRLDFWQYGTSTATGSDIATEAQYENMESNESIEYGSTWTAKDGTTARAFQQVSGLKIGEKYTISGLFKRNSTLSGHRAVVRLYRYNSSTSTFSQFGVTMGATSGASPDFKFAEQTFEALDGTIYVQIEIINSIEQQCEIAQLMLNEGDLPYSWTKHYEEIYSTGIHFNINGIRVQSEKNYTQMTPTDFSGFVLEGLDEVPRRIFTLNGDTTEVANLKAEDSIVMGNIRIVKNNNGWSFNRNSQ